MTRYEFLLLVAFQSGKRAKEWTVLSFPREDGLIPGFAAATDLLVRRAEGDDA
jgi:hypothetical protein